jgi:lipopolysaccharide assembly outer membrane protein LptD (OstA)
MKRLTGVAILLATLLAGTAMAQDSKAANYQELSLRKAGKLYANFKTGNFIQRMVGGVHLVFVAEDKANNLDVKATEIDFEYAGTEDKSPSKMILTGEVAITSGAMVIKAPKAVIDLKTMQADFTGDSEIVGEDGEHVFADAIHINLDTGEVDMDNPRIDKFELMKK